jgi:hypothetical protein
MLDMLASLYQLGILYSEEPKIRDSTITIRQFEKWRTPFFPIGIFKNMEENNRKVVARFSDACEKVFSNIEEEETRNTVIEYLRQKAGIWER